MPPGLRPDQQEGQDQQPDQAPERKEAGAEALFEGGERSLAPLAGLANLAPPLVLNAAEPDGWPLDRADAIVCINMVHISSWAATQGLMVGAARVLPVGGALILYGPYIEDGVETAPSNLAFDADLKRRDPAWGLRDLADVAALAAEHGLSLAERVAMPANNLCLLFRR
jgi:hypothetical protein